MGRFEISLPDNIKGEVRSGKVIKMQKGFLDLLLPWKKVNREEKQGILLRLNLRLKIILNIACLKQRKATGRRMRMV